MSTRRELAVRPPEAFTGVRPMKLEPLSQADYEIIKAHLPYRYLLLTKVLRNTGLREAEVLRRTAECFVQEGPTHWVLTLRGKKATSEWEAVALHPELGIEIQAFIRGNRIRPGERVFAFTARHFQRLFWRAAMEALGRPAHPHQLRALYTGTLIDGGVPVAAAAKLLGHEDERTTLRYYYELTREKRLEIAKRMPV